MKEEIDKTLVPANINRATGLDNITAELLKLPNDENIWILTVFFTKIYQCGQIPDWCLKSLLRYPII